jgi:hypothetical protein
MEPEMNSQMAALDTWRGRHVPFSGAAVLTGLLAAAVLLSADIHLALYFDGYSGIPVIGSLFLLNAAGGILIGVTVLIWRHWLPVLGGIGFGTATLTGFLLSRTVGLLGLHLTSWDPQAVLAMTGDTVALITGVALLLRRHSRVR